MSNNAPDYEDNLVFPPQPDQTVGEPEGKLKGKVTPFSEQEINNARVEAAKLIATAVGAATYELKDQLQIKDMRISKLKQKNAKMREVLKKCKNLCMPYAEKPLSPSEAKNLLCEICEVLND